MSYSIMGRSLAAYCREHKIPYQAIYQYLKDGRADNVEEALQMYIFKRKLNGYRSKYIYKGYGLARYCRLAGIKYYNVSNRMFHLGMTLEDAIQDVINKYGGKDVPGIDELNKKV